MFRVKNENNHVGNISSYTWQKEACLKKLDKTNDSEKINFFEMAREFELLNENGKKYIFLLSWEECYTVFLLNLIKKSPTVKSAL